MARTSNIEHPTPNIQRAKAQGAIAAIVNCYAADGRNVAQVVLRDGPHLEVFGDEAIGRRALQRLANAITISPR